MIPSRPPLKHLYSLEFAKNISSTHPPSALSQLAVVLDFSTEAILQLSREVQNVGGGAVIAQVLSEGDQPGVGRFRSDGTGGPDVTVPPSEPCRLSVIRDVSLLCESRFQCFKSRWRLERRYTRLFMVPTRSLHIQTIMSPLSVFPLFPPPSFCHLVLTSTLSFLLDSPLIDRTP